MTADREPDAALRRARLVLDHARAVEAIMAGRYQRALGLGGDGALSSRDVEDAYLELAQAQLHVALSRLDVGPEGAP